MLGIIGGSGIYNINELDLPEWKTVDSSFGTPSDQLLFGKLFDQPVVFLPRHGRGHVYSPSSVNYRANIDALKRAGVDEIVALSAVGSLNEKFPPGSFVLPNQFIDRTFNREKSFFGTGLVAHVSMAKPICKKLTQHIKTAGKNINLQIFDQATYLVMEGPQFSSKAESELYRKWSCDLIGMTNMPEAKLAREAEICYASISMVTDFDCWHPDHDEVTVETVIETLRANSENAKNLVIELMKMRKKFDLNLSCSCQVALNNAIITDPKYWDKNKVVACSAIAGRVLKDQN
ncbi:MAG: methylthioadenosine phosphorylase [Betaproteobacteria bacterium TMED41]|nr:MAG: methylthioadenosine phosphorylase [Betaproteobacteria bacterium TMED41]|tara:strand:+ start:1564 stop:2433 length:870 start_codon:yes stop_codon:yes gene_type:complete